MKKPIRFLAFACLGVGAAAAALVPMAAGATVDAAIAAFTGGADVAEGGIALNAPEIAENGNAVPIDVGAEGAAEIMLLAAGNPTPALATANFGPLAGAHRVPLRIRLAETQDVIGIARMPDGTFTRISANVKVTIGGCGG